jgi:hypothetical protein
MAQIYFLSADYEKCIYLYKQILNSIEISLSNKENESQSNSKANENEEDNDLSDYVDQTHLINKNMDLSRTSLSNKEPIKDERLIQMIYFTLSNIGLCMECE